ncbi:hypothetical protein [Streptococcus equi]|nr:hypothetical protein [Streptococcus equi]
MLIFAMTNNGGIRADLVVKEDKPLPGSCTGCSTIGQYSSGRSNEWPTNL